MPKELVARKVEANEETREQTHTDVTVSWGGRGIQVEVSETEWGADYYDGDLSATPRRQETVLSQELAWHEVNNLIKTLRRARDHEYGMPA
jgi:formylglycine-generating enzyme required for sulfatase activity